MEKTVEQIVLSGDLTQLTDQQRLVHYNNVCDSMDIDPRPHPLEYMVVDDPNGGRRLVLYALKNCTDQLRSRRKIRITKLTREITEDMITYTAEAEDKDGGADISTGSVSTKGKKGSDLSNASMFAETKAKRRVTLSISGAGLLDETEIADINAPTSLPAGVGVTAAPNVSTPTVNETAGKEVKLPPKEEEKPAPTKKSDTIGAGVASLKSKKVVEEKPATFFDAHPTEPIPNEQSAAASVTPSTTAVSAEKTEFVLSTTPTTPAVPAASISPADAKEALSKRITEYKRDVLPAGGMRPSKGYGINAKFSKFLLVRFPDRKNINDFTHQELQDTLDQLDEVRKEKGDAGVVALIDAEIGTK